MFTGSSRSDFARKESARTISAGTLLAVLNIFHAHRSVFAGQPRSHSFGKKRPELEAGSLKHQRSASNRYDSFRR
jgi:hypothetical protein